MSRERFKNEVIEKALAYGVVCAKAKNMGTSFPRPERMVSQIFGKYRLFTLDGDKREMVKALTLFGAGIYYFNGEFDGTPSRRFLVELLQKTEFFKVLDFLKTQVSETRFYPRDPSYLELLTGQVAVGYEPDRRFA